MSPTFPTKAKKKNEEYGFRLIIEDDFCGDNSVSRGLKRMMITKCNKEVEDVSLHEIIPKLLHVK